MSLEIYASTRRKWRKENPTLKLRRTDDPDPGAELPWLRHKTLTVVSTNPNLRHDEEVVWISAAWKSYYVNFLNPRTERPDTLTEEVCDIGSRYPVFMSKRRSFLDSGDGSCDVSVEESEL